MKTHKSCLKNKPNETTYSKLSMSFLVRFGGKSGEFGHGETGSIQNTHCNEPDMPPNSTRKSTIKNFPYPNSAQMTMISQDTRAVETASD